MRGLPHHQHDQPISGPSLICRKRGSHDRSQCIPCNCSGGSHYIMVVYRVRAYRGGTRRLVGSAFSKSFRSAPQMPHASTAMSISPLRGSGTGRSTSSRRPGAAICIARKVLAKVDLPSEYFDCCLEPRDRLVNRCTRAAQVHAHVAVTFRPKLLTLVEPDPRLGQHECVQRVCIHT